MNVFCQAESVLPRTGDIPVWNAETCRWEFRAEPGGGQGGYLVGEWKDWHEQTPPMGWRARDGQVLGNASLDYPELLIYLERPENAWKLKTEAEWQTLSQAAGGRGGAWFYVVDKAADTIRLPDTRGDSVKNAGGRKGGEPEGGVYNVADWHGDAIREIMGGAAQCVYGANELLNGPFGLGARQGFVPKIVESPSGDKTERVCTLTFHASRTVPTSHENRVRAGMLLGCVYVGR